MLVDGAFFFLFLDCRWMQTPGLLETKELDTEKTKVTPQTRKTLKMSHHPWEISNNYRIHGLRNRKLKHVSFLSRGILMLCSLFIIIQIYTFLMRRNSLWSSSYFLKWDGSPLSIIKSPPNEAFISLKNTITKTQCQWAPKFRSHRDTKSWLVLVIP